jgi:hypothetical protein
MHQIICRAIKRPIRSVLSLLQIYITESMQFGQGDGIGHYGPGQAYMSKAPGKLEDYKGDGDWFKIGLSGSSDGQHWDSDRAPEVLKEHPRSACSLTDVSVELHYPTNHTTRQISGAR